MKITLIAVPPLNTRFPALNIALLAGELKAHGYSVKSMDLNIEAFAAANEEGKKLWDFRNGHLWFDEKYFEEEIYQKHLAPLQENWLQRILTDEPDIVGISVTPNSFPVRLAKEIKARRPETKIIFGGPTCSQVMGCNVYYPNEYIDAVASDESERSLIELVKQYEATHSMVPVQGVTTLVEGKPQFGGIRPAIPDLDQTAYPDFSDLNLKLYMDPQCTEPSWELPIYTSRGCVGRCNFCMDYKMWSVYYRQKSPKRVANEMEYLWKTFGVKNFIFIELVFNGHHAWIAKFCEELRQRQLGFRFWSHGRVDGRLSPELLKSLREVGFWQFMFGMESASDKVLKLMRKGTTKAKAVSNLMDCHAAGINAAINIIVGYPGEDAFDFLETILFVVKYRKYIHWIPSITPCHATPGTDLYLNPQKFNIKIDLSRPEGSREWVSLDGKNTYRVRVRRKKILEFVCRNILFASQQSQQSSWVIKKDRFWGSVFASVGWIYENSKVILSLGSRRQVQTSVPIGKS